jgi:hypothetical protein
MLPLSASRDTDTSPLSSPVTESPSQKVLAAQLWRQLEARTSPLLSPASSPRSTNSQHSQLLRRMQVPSESPGALSSFSPSPLSVELPAWQQLQTLKSLKVINDQEDERCDDLSLKRERSRRTSQSPRTHGQRYGAADAGGGDRRGLSAGMALARSVSPVLMSRRISLNINSRILKPLGSARCQESRINPFQV